MAIFGPIGFDKGLISRSTVFVSPQGSLYTCSNFRSFYGSLEENYGTKNINGSSLGTGVGFCNGIFPADISTTIPMITVVDGKIYTVSVTGTTVDISGAATLSTSVKPCTADTLNGIMVIGDPGDTAGWLAQWSGSGNATKLTAAPDGRVVLTVNNFMFVSYVDSAPSTVYWSAVSDPTTWPGTNNITFRQGDGDKVVALSYIGTDLYIFKQHSIGRLTTVSTTVSGAVTLGPLQTVSVGIGAATARAVDRLPDGRLIFWASNGHAYIFDGSTMSDISDQQFPYPSIQDLFTPIQTDLSGMTVTVYPPRAEVWFTTFLLSGSIVGRQMIYNYQSNQWFDFEPNSAGGSPPASPVTFSAMQYLPLNDGKGLTTAGAFPYSGTLVGGSFANGYIYAFDHSGSTDNFSAQWNISVQLGSEGRMFIPRSLIMFVRSVTSDTPTILVSYGFDNGGIGNNKNLVLSSTYSRFLMNFIIPSTAFSTMQLQLVVAGNNKHGVHLEPFWLSDEVMV